MLAPLLLSEADHNGDHLAYFLTVWPSHYPLSFASFSGWRNYRKGEEGKKRRPILEG
jgi:hypothetical protein